MRNLRMASILSFGSCLLEKVESGQTTTTESNNSKMRTHIAQSNQTATHSFIHCISHFPATETFIIRQQTNKTKQRLWALIGSSFNLLLPSPPTPPKCRPKCVVEGGVLHLLYHFLPLKKTLNLDLFHPHSLYNTNNICYLVAACFCLFMCHLPSRAVVVAVFFR